MDNYRISFHVFGKLNPSITDAEAKALEDSNFHDGYDGALIYQLGEDYFRNTEFGELKDPKIVDVSFNVEDKELIINIEGWFWFTVEADSCTEAEKKAGLIWDDADFGEFENADYDSTVIRRTF